MASLNALLKRLPQISSLKRDILPLSVSLEEFATPWASRSGTVVLLSGGAMDCARYHILAAEPWLSLVCHGKHIEVTVSGESFVFSMDPFEALSSILAFFKVPCPHDSSSPVASGLFGYFSYDLKDRIEVLPRTCSPRNLPDLFLVLPSVVVVHDKMTHTTELFSPVLSPSSEFNDIASYIAQHRKEISARAVCAGADGQYMGEDSEKNGSVCPGPTTGGGGYSIDPSGFVSNFTRESYMAAVDRILSYIRAGDIYQVNLSQRYETGFQGDAYTLFRDLYHRNPAPFFAFVNAGDHQIVSTSPERFIRQAGRHLETRPIKGTLPRGKTPGEDEALAKELSSSTKDDAELSMIVDLMRNDLGRVARGGSVEVTAHKRLEPYDNVFHLVSVVTAELDRHLDAVDVIRATFPGGSITGCPKIRAMEIIDELESVQRHVYTGSLGYLSFHDTMDLSIAIRTATVANGKINYSVGGGIVFDSNPAKEYEETLHKGKTLMDVLTLKGSHGHEKPLSAWVNGKIIPQDRATLQALSPGGQYGAGIFETIRVHRGKPCFFSEHIKRFNASWEALFETAPPDISWETIIAHLVDVNGLGQTVAAVKIMAALGQGAITGTSGRTDFLAIFARPYVHRLEAIQQPGLRLVSYPFYRHTPLADHKTLNYFFYHRAGQYAMAHQGDEALILNPDGSLSETNTCTLFALSDKTLYLPRSPHVLPGVTGRMAGALLEKEGYDVKIKKITMEEICAMDHVCAANALMGVVPVISIDDHPLVPATDFCRRLNHRLDGG
jgi:para-aminobenzoate synthetase component 1